MVSNKYISGIVKGVIGSYLMGRLSFIATDEVHYTLGFMVFALGLGFFVTGLKDMWGELIKE